MKTTARFHPQAWVNNYAIEVDPEGDVAFDVGDVPDDMQDNTNESDALAKHPNAPEWIRDWTGPMWIEILRGDFQVSPPKSWQRSWTPPTNS